MRKIILALDVGDPALALDIVDRFKDQIAVFKVGLELFSAGGPDVVRAIHDRGRKVFLDLKFHDIPTTVARAGEAAARMGVAMFNLHASNGSETMKRCREAVETLCARKGIERPRLLGVTVLTSMSQETLSDELFVKHSLRTHVRHLAELARDSGMDGVVASAQEVATIRKHCGGDFLLVTPGIRPSWTPPDDQKRTMTPREAIHEGADFLVMGRSILKQPDPARALDLISLEILTA